MTDFNPVTVHIPVSALIDGAITKLPQDADLVITTEIRVPATASEPQPQP